MGYKQGGALRRARWPGLQPGCQGRKAPRMLEAPGWLYAVSHAFALWGLRAGGDCRCVFEGQGIDAQVLGLLQRQLDRCGPANLTCSACPACPVCGPADPAVGVLASAGILVFLVGVVVGAITGGAWARGLASTGPETNVSRSRSKSIAPLLVQDSPAAPTPVPASGVLTPTAKRGLRLT